MLKKPELDLNPEFLRAFRLMEDSQSSVFITGKAGTGKSTLLSYFRDKTLKNTAVLAPTGVAALNIGGQTIHSFFGFKPDITEEQTVKIAGKLIKRGKTKLYTELDILVIDEISMVRPDLLDCADAFLRTLRHNPHVPFGGVKLVFIGDLYQLPPVVKSGERELFSRIYGGHYFFDSKVFKRLRPEFVELEKIYRQKDERFIKLLNSVRNNSARETELAALNARYHPHFVPPEDEFFVYLTPTNAKAASVNGEKLAALPGKPAVYPGAIEGDFDSRLLPTEEELVLKAGAQIMLLNNDSMGRWVNGSMGKVVALLPDGVQVELDDGEIEEVKPFTWNMFNYRYNEELEKIETEAAGGFTQLPLKLAWAVTIHKSQGKTFDRLILDLDRGLFASSQLYVALSRCRSLEGIILKTRIQKAHIRCDWRVVRFLTDFQYKKSDEELPREEKLEVLRSAIRHGGSVEMIYLRANGEKSKRRVKPLEIADCEFMERSFEGLRALCSLRKEERVFRIDRILELKEVRADGPEKV
ncbi:MAG TPA: AAA family ATPase [Elusimicrobia bacterium]|nr:AAA family ATPase [Elusimicrobiota bacterium]